MKYYFRLVKPYCFYQYSIPTAKPKMNRTARILKLTAPELNRFLREHPLDSENFDEIEAVSRALWHITSVYKTHAIGHPSGGYIHSTASPVTYDLINDSLTLACDAYEKVFEQNTPLQNANQFYQATHTLSRLTSIERTLDIVPIPQGPEPEKFAPQTTTSKITDTPSARTVPVCRTIGGQTTPTTNPEKTLIELEAESWENEGFPEWPDGIEFTEEFEEVVRLLDEVLDIPEPPERNRGFP